MNKIIKWGLVGLGNASLNVAKEFPSSRILHPLKKWCDYEFTTLNFWNVDFSQAKSSVTSLST